MSLNQKKIKLYAPFIRLSGNFGVTFLSSFVSFNFVDNIPSSAIINGALMTSLITTFIVLFYEAQKFNLRKGG